MKDKQKSLMLIIIMILSIIIIGLTVYIISLKGKEKSQGINNNSKVQTTTVSKEENNEDEDYIEVHRRINLDEDFSIDEGKVEGIENLRWHNARINQEESITTVEISLDNDSQTEKIEARELTVNLLDKDNNVVVSKNVQMEEIEADGYTYLDIEFETEQYFIVYDIQIIAK